MTVSALLAALILLSISKTARSGLLRLITADSSGRKSVRVNWAVAAAMVSLLLLIVMEPESRVFLMFIDAVGLDFFVLLLLCQLQSNVCLAGDRIVMPILRRLKKCAPFPMDLPTARVIRDYPYLSACGMFGIVMSASFMFAMCLPFAIGVALS